MKFVRFIMKNAALASVPKHIEHFSKFSPSPLSMKQFIDFGSINACEKTSFVFLRQELPVRLSNIMKEINLLPDKLLTTQSVQMVQSWYIQSLLEILEFLDKNPDDYKVLGDFVDTLVTIRNRHNDVVPTMAQGIIEYKESFPHDPITNQNIQYFLDRFYMSRISIRMLINQHTLIFDGTTNPVHPNTIGSIDPHCQVGDVVQDAFHSAKMLCDQYYLRSPDLILKEMSHMKNLPINIVYVPSHLYHMLFELFKNAMRATIETHENSNSLPPIQVMVSLGGEDLSIKVSDKGGGVPFRRMENLFSYMYSTAPAPQMGEHTRPPLAGFGYGLPISRLYAKYFQGDLQLYSMEGHGTDAVIYLKALSTDSIERLPVYNKTALKNYKVSQEADDWCIPSKEPLDLSNYKTELKLWSMENQTMAMQLSAVFKMHKVKHQKKAQKKVAGTNALMYGSNDEEKDDVDFSEDDLSKQRDPCYHYTVLDQAWRATNTTTKYKMCDRQFKWKGWYRLFYNGKSLQMPERCVPMNKCGTNSPLWLAGPHPKRRQGIVKRRVCGHWKKNCCAFQSTPIKVKKCRGNYFVYKFTKPTSCYLAYCAGIPLPQSFFFDIKSSDGFQNLNYSIILAIDINTLVCGRCSRNQSCVSRDKINWRCKTRKSRSRKVHFFASYPGQLKGKVNRIKYTKVLVNVGRAFNRRTGVFKAPVNGVYQFFFSTQSSNAGLKTDLWLVVNNYWVAVSHTHVSRPSTVGSLSTYMTFLRKGAVVYVTQNSGMSWANSASTTITFGGSLLVQWRK
ncbi:hypothetical protein L3Q82_010564 [Scortum barcoo]|uniref:Uncharacterized protein n=1 Tax=Scortum barcoo TaxID=214431 RepID=A0ACB8WCB5_9TELE|nr:hypothetical protein L3Q82_010564 [Scortum barcoo]